MSKKDKKQLAMRAPAPAQDNKKCVVLQTLASLRDYTAELRAQDLTLALVPTMGALHEGHLELVREALSRADRAIVSIFVNPTQFGPNEDYAAYPRTWETDLAKLESVGAHAVFHPTAREMYPHGFSTTVSVAGVSEGLCGAARPGHFNGVATVVTKLLLLVGPDVALFGEKDFQQLAVIRRLVEDLDIPAEIVGVPVVRDEKGLALSSRNAYLKPAQYEIATQLNRILFAMARRIAQGEALIDVKNAGLKDIKSAGFDSADYLEICNAATLRPAEQRTGEPLRILAAVRLGKTRLIDNVPVT